MACVILVRHGESLWNKKELWTGLEDVSLTQKGKNEATEAALAIKKIGIDTAFTSTLKRSKETLDEIVNVLKVDNLSRHESSALNERDYGDFTGKNKWEIKKKYGENEFLKIRRAWNYPIPNGETLKDVYNRVLPYYHTSILPELMMGRNVLIVAHGNSLRTLIKYLEDISDEEISKFEIATGEVYLYEVDKKGKVLSKKVLVAKQND